MKKLSKVLAIISIFALFAPAPVYAKSDSSKDNRNYDSSHSRSYSNKNRRPPDDTRTRLKRRNIVGDNSFHRFDNLNNIDYIRFQKALTALHDKNFEKADVMLERLNTRFNKRRVPPNVLAFITYHKAVAQFGLNNNKEAIEYFRQVADLAPNSFVRTKDAGIYEAYTALGVVYASSGQFDDVQYTLEMLKYKSKTCLETCGNHDRINTAVNRLEAIISNANQ